MTIPAPAPSSPRLVVPDVARGLALWGIALANLPTAWLIAPPEMKASFFGGIRTTASGGDNVWDSLITVLAALFVHNRGLPLFSTLLGFGVGLISISLWRKNFPLPRARAIIARRYLWLAVFGLIHGIFLFYGDIMMLYGIAGMILAAMLTVTPKTLRWIVAILLGLTFIGFMAVAGLVYAIDFDLDQLNMSGGALINSTSYGSLLLSNLLMMLSQLVGASGYLFIYGPLFLIGFNWARRGVLSDVAAHRTELLRWVAAGVAVIIVIGLPWGLATIGVLPESLSSVFLILNSGFGVLTGPAALAALALLLKADTVPPLLKPFAALGKRSMSGYVLQSVLFFAIVMPFTAGLSNEIGAATMALVATAVWALTVVAAWLLELAGAPGPLEQLHRRLAYGPDRTPRLEARASAPARQR